MKRILFPTDFSDAANNALKVALNLVNAVDSKLFVLHSMNSVQQYVDISLSTAGDITMPGMQPDVVMASIDQERKRVTEKMEMLTKELREKNISVESEIIYQALEFEINDYVAKNDIDFIVMGTRGSSGLREAFIGSVAQKIVRLARVPVLTVSGDCKQFQVKKVVYCSDFTEVQINEQLTRVKAFVDVFDAELSLVYVNTPTYFEETKPVMDRMARIVSQYSLGEVSTHIYNAFDIDEGVITFAQQQNADIIAMITHGYRGVRKLFSDNITESVVNHCPIPVLTLHIN